MASAHFYGEVSARVPRHLGELVGEFSEGRTGIGVQHPTCKYNPGTA